MPTVTRSDYQQRYEELRIGAPSGSRQALAVLLRSGVASWMAVLSVSGKKVPHGGRIRSLAPPARHEIIQVLAAMVTGNLQGVHP